MTYVIDEVRVAHFRNLMRAGAAVERVLLRQLPNGRHEPVDGVQRIEAAKREGYDWVGACIIECTDREAEELRRKLNQYDWRVTRL